MTETKNKRRGWVKNAAIIFLSVLLVLTFFSNTILNRSLPEVAAQYPTSGTINLKIRGTGVVSSNQTQNVSIAESRKVKGIAIRAGDVVEKGQALFLLADTDSEELNAAKETLDALELAYEKVLLDASLSDTGSNYDVLKAQIALEEAVERRDKAQLYDAEREPLEKEVEAAAEALADAMNNADQLPEKQWLEQAQEELEKAKAAQEKANTDFSYYTNLHGVGDYGNLADQLETLYKEIVDLKDQLYEIDSEVNELEKEKKTAENAEHEARTTLESTIKEAANSYLNSPKPTQQLGEIQDQYIAAKSMWDTLVDAQYDVCVKIENDNTERTFIGPVWLRDVLVFVTTPDYGDSDEADEMLETPDTLSNAELKLVYRSMVWWHMTYDAAKAYEEAVTSDNGLEAIEAELELKYEQQDTLWDQLDEKEAEYDEQRAILKDPELANAYDAVLRANEAVKLANDAVYSAQLAYDDAAKSPSANIDAAQKAYDSAKEKLEALDRVYEGVGSYADEKANVLSAQQALESLYQQQQAEDINTQKENLDLQKQKEELDEQRALVEELEKAASETIIYSPCDGTVLAVNVTAGDTTIMNEPMAEIELTDQGHTLTFEVTKQQAAQVNIGDQAEINDRWGVDIRATLVSVTSSKTDPANSKVLTFDLKGEDVVPGQSLTLSVGQRSQDYEVIVPNSAVKQDAQGKFVLVVTSKNTPLGNRFYVKRVDVEVLASDDNNSALKGDLTAGEFVMITSTAPIADGDQVRLPE